MGWSVLFGQACSRSRPTRPPKTAVILWPRHRRDLFRHFSVISEKRKARLVSPEPWLRFQAPSSRHACAEH